MDHDVLKDEGIMFARRLEAGGVKVKLAQCPGTHGLFNLMGMKYAQRELGNIAKYITDYVWRRSATSDVAQLRLTSHMTSLRHTLEI